MSLSVMALLVAWLVPLASSQFVPPAAILQAGYPAGFRAFIPDFPGCEMFAFHAKVNSPFIGDEAGTFSQDILRPHRGFWVFQDLSTILTPGDIIHYWTLVVKDGVGYPKRNQTWKVPDPDESVDLLSPVTLKPPTKRAPNPEKMIESEPTAQTEDDTTTPMVEMSSVDENTASSVVSDSTEMSTSNPDSTSTTPNTSPTTESTTTSTKTSPTSSKSLPSTESTPKPTTMKKIPKTAAKPKKSTPPPPNPLMEEDVEELTTSALPFDKPISSEFPQEPPPLVPFPSVFQIPFKPPKGLGFELCANPWNFEGLPGETRIQRLERQVAKLKCQLVIFQRGSTQLGNTMEKELADLKNLIYGMVGRMARLESVIRSAAFG